MPACKGKALVQQSLRFGIASAVQLRLDTGPALFDCLPHKQAEIVQNSHSLVGIASQRAVQSGEERGFVDLDELFAFLRSRTDHNTMDDPGASHTPAESP